MDLESRVWPGRRSPMVISGTIRALSRAIGRVSCSHTAHLKQPYGASQRWLDGGVVMGVGDRVRVEMEKWGGRPHWRFDATWLGMDGPGEWVGVPAGTPMSRPGMGLGSGNDQGGVVPSLDLPEDERWWLATFHAPDAPRVSVYVDMTTPPRWDEAVLRTVDLDLDVIRLVGGEVLVDDEDEFAEHQVELGYPRDVVALAEASRDRMHAAVRHQHPPFDGSHLTWQAVLDGLTARS